MPENNNNNNDNNETVAEPFGVLWQKFAIIEQIILLVAPALFLWKERNSFCFSTQNFRYRLQ